MCAAKNQTAHDHTDIFTLHHLYNCTYVTDDYNHLYFCYVQRFIKLLFYKTSSLKLTPLSTLLALK